jgi:hypothetical protein
MEHYWRKVLLRAWADTKSSFGLNQKTATAALIVIVGAVLAYMHTGSLPDDATKSIWYGLSLGVAGVFLFGWNFVAAQAEIFKESSAESATKIAALESAIAERKQPEKANLDAWTRVKELRLHEAAPLWCDEEPTWPKMSRKAAAWLTVLQDAIQNGDLEHVPKSWDRYETGTESLASRMVPGGVSVSKRILARSESTVVTRAALIEYAKKSGVVPTFLREP